MPDVISDTSALQYLHRLGLLDLLHRQYGTVVVPEAVVREIAAGAAVRANVPDISTLPWIQIAIVSAGSLHRVATSLGAGEREVIGLALAKQQPLAVLDDAQARCEARRLSIQFHGCSGNLVESQTGRNGEPTPPIARCAATPWILSGQRNPERSAETRRRDTITVDVCPPALLR
jgi:uncharacterized protein